MRQVSKHNTYFGSDGTRYTQQQVNDNIKTAKAQKLEDFINEHGYYFCEDCSMNVSVGVRFDLSHDVSVQEAKNTRRVELCWNVDNLTLRCRPCHCKHDKI